MRPSSTRALTTVAAAIALLLGPMAAGAGAHATLQDTEPGDGAFVDEPPESVQLRFDEAVDVIAGGVEVYDPSGARVDEELTLSDDRLAVTAGISDGGVGTYTVAWRAVSRDGHNIEGSFVFHVDEETGSVAAPDESEASADAARWIGSWLGLAGLLVALGGVFVGWIAGDEARRRVRLLVAAASATSALGWLLAAWGYTAGLAGRSLVAVPLGTVVDILGDTRAGRLLVLRAALLTIGAVAALLARKRALGSLAVPGATAAASMAITSAAGHAWTASPATLAVVVDLVHLSAAGLWAGGLLALLVAVQANPDRAVVRGYSAMALGAAAVVAATGSASAVIELPAVSSLWETTYGRLVLGKAGGFAVLLGFGWWNRRILASWADRGVRRLVDSMGSELAVALVVVGLTATLVETPPPGASELDRPIPVSATADGASVQGLLQPGAVGSNDLHLYFFAPDGSALVADAVEVTVASGGLPARRLEVTPYTPSHVSVLDISLPRPDRWRFAITAVSEGTPYVFRFDLEVT